MTASDPTGVWTLPTEDPAARPTWPAQPPSGGEPSATPSPATSTATGPTSSAISAWHSGAAGEGVADGSFGSWRGTPVQVAGTWNDTTSQVQAEQGTVGDEYASFDGDLDVAVGGLDSGGGESWQEAAKGAYSDRWLSGVRKIAAARRGKPGLTYVRFVHEMNGDWYDWKVTPGDVEAFKTSWRMYHDILKRVFPQALLVFGANADTSEGNASVTDIWPGDDVVDVVGVDFYDGWPRFGDDSTWEQHLDDAAPDGSPRGIRAWQSFAKEHGKPIAFPEWGLNPAAGDTDDPTYVRHMHDFFAANAASTGGDNAGKVAYDLYYEMENDGFKITSGRNARAGDTYRRLSWGGSGPDDDAPAVATAPAPTLTSPGPAAITPDPTVTAPRPTMIVSYPAVTTAPVWPTAPAWSSAPVSVGTGDAGAGAAPRSTASPPAVSSSGS
jgi:hypothetical protein